MLKIFTGLISELGIIKNIARGKASYQLTIDSKKTMEDLKIGDSVAVNGSCLTVVQLKEENFTVDVMPESVKLTTVQYLSVGSKVNLERTLRLSDRLDGHIVSGHVDGMGKIVKKIKDDIAWRITVGAEKDILAFIVLKGSITIDGISLTVTEVTETNFTVSIIPLTAKNTTLGTKDVGEMVNLETDVLAKYVAKLLNLTGNKSKGQSGISLALLAENGYITN